MTNIYNMPPHNMTPDEIERAAYLAGDGLTLATLDRLDETQEELDIANQMVDDLEDRVEHLEREIDA